VSRVTIAIDVGPLARAGGANRFSATTDLGGTPICAYGQTAAEAERRARGAALRVLASLLERGAADVSEVRFRMQSA
jgi:hypothetical protein